MKRPKHGLKALLMVAILWCGSPAQLWAETVDQAYANALKDYYAGRYAQAVNGLERILLIPVENEDLHYNLGCAYFRLGKLGPAIYHFERALALDSGAEDARFNLETSRSMVSAKIKDQLKGTANDPLWMRLVGMLSARSWAVLFLVFWWLSLGVLFALRYIRTGALRAGIVAGNSFLALLALLTGLLLGGRAYLNQRVVIGIVLPDQMEVREGPNSATKTSFKIHAGHRVRVQTRENGWIRIRLANGLEGWVPQQKVGII